MNSNNNTTIANEIVVCNEWQNIRDDNNKHEYGVYRTNEERLLNIDEQALRYQQSAKQQKCAPFTHTSNWHAVAELLGQNMYRNI